jgi:hypothetical protein
MDLIVSVKIVERKKQNYTKEVVGYVTNYLSKNIMHNFIALSVVLIKQELNTPKRDF